MCQNPQVHYNLWDICCTSYNHCFCTGVEDTDSFQMEMRGFLQELCCPHKQLTSDLNILASYSSRLLLIGEPGNLFVVITWILTLLFSETDFLLSEVLTARLCDLQQRQDPDPMDTGQPSYSVPANLAAILKVYGLSTPPAHITVRQVFDKLIAKVGPSINLSVYSVIVCFTN